MKSPIRKLASSKLFYNKWPFKVECILYGASRVVRSGPASVRDWCTTGGSLRVTHWDQRNIDKAKLLAFTNAVAPFLDRKDDIKIRTEGSHFNLFCLDKTVLDEIDAALLPWIKTVSGPTTDEELEFLLSNGHKKILCNTLPKEKYKYRMYFKTKFPLDKRSTFMVWADKYGDKMSICGTSKDWFDGRRMYTQDPFIYIEDDKMLSMLGLYVSGYIRKVEEFIPRESILTV